MILKILELQNVGLLHNATPNGAVDFARVTAIYAENGRGKSTLATVMRACSLRDAGRLHARRTIDSQDVPEISLLVQDGTQSVPIEFKNGVWSGTSPAMIVFDSEFVEQNVYSGLEVRADQRQSLLEFALGDQVVLLKQKVDELTADIEKQTKRRTHAERALTGYAAPYTESEFISLQPIDDAQQQIELLQKRIEATRSAQQLAFRQEPLPLPSFRLDVPALFRVLNKQLQDVEQSAEATVRAHLSKHGVAGLEDWLSRGQDYMSLGECPFCGQSLRGLDLIRAYRSYFNAAYSDLKREVADLEGRIGTGLAESQIGTIEAGVATNTARIEAWKDQLDLSVPSLPTDPLREALKAAREIMMDLVLKKRLAPLESLGSQVDRQTVAGQLATINQAIAIYNAEISAVVTKISDFKKTLATENISVMQAGVKKLEAAQKRQLPEVVTAINEYQDAETKRNQLEGEKLRTREQIDTLMKTTLQQYQDTINTLLLSFGAGFSIQQLKPSYVGTGEPRTEYVLSIRNKSVKLGSRADILTSHSFATTLSDADKRTLAFAFFIARVKTDPNVGNEVVVLDDPVSSLDRNRRHQTLRLICELAQKCRQLIFLSHDSYCIRDMRERLSDLKPVPVTPAILAIFRVQNGYSAFAPCDIDDVCSSDYYRHHRLVSDYVDGKSTANSRDVAKAMRPLLEGYYHRRFPRRIPRKILFGQIIALVQQAVPPDPLSNLAPIVNELTEVNDYAGRFHHDTNQNDEVASIVDSELLTYARRALNLIYQNG